MQPTDPTINNSTASPTSELNKYPDQKSQKSSKFKPFKSNKDFSMRQLMVFAVVFAVIGGYLIFRSFAATVTFVSDAFTNSKGIVLENRTGETGATWKLHPVYTGGKAIISDAGRLRIYSSKNTTYYASGTPTSADYSVEADITVKARTGGAGVVNRMSTTNDTFYTCRYYTVTGKWELYKFVNGSITLLGSKAATLATGSTYRLKLTSDGSRQTCSVNGSTIASVTDGSITGAGKVGIRFIAGGATGNHTGLHIDNFKASSTVEEPTTTTSTPTSPSGEPMPVGNLAGWKQIFAEDFTKDAPRGSWATTDATWDQVIYTGATGTKWKQYADGWKDTYGGTYNPKEVLSVHDGVLDFYLHSVNGRAVGANPSPVVTGTSQYQTYGRYSARFKVDNPNMKDFYVAWLLWPEKDDDYKCAESDYPEGGLKGTSFYAFHHYGCTGAQDYANTGTIDLTQWHTYTQEWTPTARKYYLDDKLIGTSTNSVFNKPQRWQLQTETNGGVGAESGHLLLDWVAVYSYSP